MIVLGTAQDRASALAARVARRGRAFTIIEMLVVIAIIAILASIVVPVLASAKVRTKIMAARVDMKTIESAANAYQSTYTLPPIPNPNPYPNFRAATDFSFSDTNSDIIAILMDYNGLANGPPLFAEHFRNPQKHPFLEVPLKESTNVQGVSRIDYNFRDPWGTPYVIAFDLNFDNQVDVPNNIDRVYKLYPSIGIQRSVIVWSKGPDREAEERNPGTGSDRDGKNKDNIRSWE